MRRTSVLMVLLVAITSLGAGRPSGIRPVHFVVGQDIAGADAFTVERETVVMVNPQSRRAMSVARQAARRALGLEALQPSAETRRRLSPDCQSELLMNSGPILTEVPEDDCGYGSPSCTNWKTYLSGPVPQCAFAAIDCLRLAK